MAEDFLYFNGIDGESGTYDLPPMTGGEFSSFILGTKPPENLRDLRLRRHLDSRNLAIIEGVDPLNLAEAGWGVIFPDDADPAIQEALEELIKLRREQAGVHFKLYSGSQGYHANESKTDFLSRHGAGPGPADPDKVPYYLLMVGSPQQFSYQFQTQLDVQYAVGRIYFDTLEEYANYARSVVDAEKGKVKLPLKAVFFGVANEDDRATQMSAEYLISPLQSKFQSSLKDWEVGLYLGEQTQKAQLSRLLGGDQTPAMLVTASHGISFPKDNSRQISHQGAFLCQDWPGPDTWIGRGAIPQDFYFAADDLSNDAKLLGLIAFFFACYGAGTPLLDEFSMRAFKQKTAIAPYPFLARLPIKLLGHPHGGALAVIGHVERAWGYSFMWPKAGAQTAVFESCLQRLFKGHPVGSAFEYFNQRYAELSTVLNDELEKIAVLGIQDNSYELAGLWTANNDARNYVILGDPAVRLPVTIADDEA